MNTVSRNKLVKARHYVWLKELGYKYDSLGKINGLERRAHKLMEDNCNFEIAESTFERKVSAMMRELTELFDGELPKGAFINQDPRGYALKIDDDVIRAQADKWQAQGYWPYTDMGGYGILAPDFE